MTPGDQAEVMRKGRELIRVGIVRGDRCAFCGAEHYQEGKRPWEGWEIKTLEGLHQYYIADKPENLCPCERRGE